MVTTVREREIRRKKTAHPALEMRVWHFWHEFVTCVCPICVYASRVQIWKQSLSFSLSFLLLLSVMNRSRRFTIFLASSTFPFMNSICIPFGDRKRLRFDMPRGVEKKKPALWICIHGCIKVSFSLSSTVWWWWWAFSFSFFQICPSPTTAAASSTLCSAGKITNDETKDRLLSLWLLVLHTHTHTPLVCSSVGWLARLLVEFIIISPDNNKRKTKAR